MEELDSIFIDDTEAKYLALKSKKKNRKRKRRRIRLIILLIVMAVGLMYFISDFSKVKSLDIDGNVYYTKEDILTKTGLSYNTRYLLIPSFYVEWKLEQDELIEDVKMIKDIDGRISLQIQEKLIVGYMVADDQNYVVASDGKQYPLDSSHLNTIVNLPLIDGFSEEELINMAKSFDKRERIDDQVMKMISEIHPYKTNYDPNMIKVVMQDGNKIYTSYESLFLLNTYKLALKELKSTHVCMFMDATTSAIATQNCEDFEKSGEKAPSDAPKEEKKEEN